MSGHRDDGTFAEDKAHHPNRKVGRDTPNPYTWAHSCSWCGAGAGKSCKAGCKEGTMHPDRNK